MKIIFAIIFSTLFSTLLFAQSFSGGLIAGTTISQVDGDNYGGYHKISPLAGVFVRNTFNDSWGMYAGIEYKRKGSKEVQKNDAGYVVHFYAMHLDYIEVPVLATHNIKKIGIPGLFSYSFDNDFLFNFGLSYSYLIKGTEDDGTGIIPEEGRPFRKYEIAQHVGLDYNLSENWIASWRFSYTFIMLPIREFPGGQVYWFNRGQYNHNMSFAIKYEF
ncbi:MAG: PorT family protein [Bacteroidales bacterium]|nr:PorT family protein [Bacteroidales bacterium]